ncbi:hypothetical protein, partial [uncultured Parabacteroides sp.]|uniref:hypothetical protein n=1 Tax=uncultured Parabacteroides sp. TaxID=512312 RepID=UPI0026120915
QKTSPGGDRHLRGFVVLRFEPKCTLTDSNPKKVHFSFRVFSLPFALNIETGKNGTEATT